MKSPVGRVQLSGAAAAIMYGVGLVGASAFFMGGPRPGWGLDGWLVFACFEVAVALAHAALVVRDVLVASAPSSAPWTAELSVLSRIMFGGQIVSYAGTGLFASIWHLAAVLTFGADWSWDSPGSQPDPVLASSSVARFTAIMGAFAATEIFMLSLWFPTIVHHSANQLVAAKAAPGAPDRPTATPTSYASALQ